MIVAIDAGNTRIKWGVHDGSDWIALGALATGDATALAGVCHDWPPEAKVLACNVAGDAVAAAITQALGARFGSPLWLRARDAGCGVVNSYASPERLGADRWAALIAARALRSEASIVVGMGTATTVDWLDADGVFRGGLILPGFDLMRSALARNTAQLPFADGRFELAPRTTADAVVSGCLHAQLGAIERMFAKIALEPGARCVLTGGAAERVVGHLSIPFVRVDTLVLDGLVRFGASR